MRTPFTAGQFFEVFGRYNEAFWPAQAGLYVSEWSPSGSRFGAPRAIVGESPGGIGSLRRGTNHPHAIGQEEIMKTLRSCFALVALATASCATVSPPFPVTGTRSGIQALAGSWVGEYSSTSSGRSGSIRFTLAAGKDTAFGDVLMLPRRTVQTTTNREGVVVEPRPEPRTLSITFVRAAGDSVQGLLDPYEDPDCRCTLTTWFTGRIRGDRIEGHYSTRSEETGQRTFGEWSVRRQKDKATTATQP